MGLFSGQTGTAIFVTAVVVMNVITFAMYGIDKKKAKKHKWRIPEKTLIGMSFAFGSVGALLGMYVFRHKTQHIKFKVLVPLSFILQLMAIFVLHN